MKAGEIDPLVCPKCQGSMRIISFIGYPSVIRDILNHLGLWLGKGKTAAISNKKSNQKDRDFHLPLA